MVLVASGVVGAVPASAHAVTIWSHGAPVDVQTDSDRGPVTLGTPFVPRVEGSVSGVRFWKTPENDGVHEASLWTADGALLATATFEDETESGWQLVTLDEPVPVEVGERYVVAYHSTAGRYAVTEDFTGGSRSEELYVSRGRSGVYSYGAQSSFPDRTWRSSQYWVDLTFEPEGGRWWTGDREGKSRSKGGGESTATSSPTAEETTAPSPTTSPTPSPDPTVSPEPTPTATPSSTSSPDPVPSPSQTSTAPPSSTPTPAPARTVDPPSAGDRPGPTNTGVPSGVSLRSSRGLTVTTDNTVLDGLSIDGSVTIDARNVVIKNSRITGDGDGNGIYVRNGSLTISDSEIVGFENGIAGGSWTADRVEISGMTGDGVKVGSDVTLRNSWIHGLTPGPGAHADGLQVQGGVSDTLIENNTISAYDAATDINGNTAMFIAPDLGPSAPGPLVIRNNWLDGGNFTVQILDGNYGQFLIDDISFTGNRFGRSSVYGPLRVNVDVTLSGNVWDDNGRSIG